MHFLQQMESNKGDIHDRFYRQAIAAAGSGCKAAREVEWWLEGYGILSKHGKVKDGLE